MKKFARVLTLILSLILCFSLFACETGTTTDQGGNLVPETPGGSTGDNNKPLNLLDYFSTIDKVENPDMPDSYEKLQTHLNDYDTAPLYTYSLEESAFDREPNLIRCKFYAKEKNTLIKSISFNVTSNNACNFELNIMERKQYVRDESIARTEKSDTYINPMDEKITLTFDYPRTIYSYYYLELQIRFILENKEDIKKIAELKFCNLSFDFELKK